MCVCACACTCACACALTRTVLLRTTIRLMLTVMTKLLMLVAPFLKRWTYTPLPEQVRPAMRSPWRGREGRCLHGGMLEPAHAACIGVPLRGLHRHWLQCLLQRAVLWHACCTWHLPLRTVAHPDNPDKLSTEWPGSACTWPAALHIHQHWRLPTIDTQVQSRRFAPFCVSLQLSCPE